MPIPVCSMLLPLQGWLTEFTSESSLTRVCNTNYISLLSPIASAPCVTSVLRSLPALAAQATSNRNWGPCDEHLSVQDFPTFIKHSKTFWGLPVTRTLFRPPLLGTLYSYVWFIISFIHVVHSLIPFDFERAPTDGAPTVPMKKSRREERGVRGRGQRDRGVGNSVTVTNSEAFTRWRGAVSPSAHLRASHHLLCLCER